MVRLKAAQIGNRWDDFGISIPYGAIKSIKGILDILGEMEFQFLMVRLKEMQKDLTFLIFVISIPYGAIKRPPVTPERDAHYYFNSLWCD